MKFKSIRRRKRRENLEIGTKQQRRGARRHDVFESANATVIITDVATENAAAAMMPTDKPAPTTVMPVENTMAHADPVTTTAASKDSDWSILPHPLADIFPLLDEDGLRALAEDIRANGLREPIVLYEGQILDGRCRYRACEIAGVVADTLDYAGTDPVAFVVSKNLRRRHLTESQRAMVAALLAELPRGANQHTAAGMPIGTAAELMNVSKRSVARAKEVLRHGDATLVEAAKTGALTVSAAANRLRKTKSNKENSAAGSQNEVEGDDDAAPTNVSPLLDREKKARWERIAKAAAANVNRTVPGAVSDEILTSPPFLDQQDPNTVNAKNDAAFASLTAAWEKAAELRRAWATAPAIVRDHFIVNVLRRQSDEESPAVE
jgi:ParB-like nuclease domain